MEIRKFAKRLTLALTAVLLAGALLVTAAAAEINLPEMPDWGSQAWDSGSGMHNDFGAEAQLSADVTANDLPMVHLWLTDGSNTHVYTAFYALDSATGNTYLLSFAGVGKMIEKYDLSCSLKSLKGSGSVEYLGNDGVFAYFRSDALSGYTPLKLGDTASDSVLLCALLIDDSGNPDEVTAINVDLSTWENEDDLIFKNTSEENDITLFNGMPVISAEDGTVIGMTYTTGYLCIVRFGGVNYEFAQKYALSTNSGGSGGQGGSEEPDEPDEPDKPDKPDESEKDNTKLYLIIGAAAVAAFLFYKKIRGGQKPDKSRDGSISLDTGAETVGGGLDSSGGRIDSVADGSGLDIYGPTVQNETKGSGTVDLSGSAKVDLGGGGTVPLALWQLRGVEGPLRAQVYPLSSSLTIGRGAQCDVRFPQDAPGVSGNHCRVSVKDDKVYIQDLGSSYGTFYPQSSRLNPGTEYPLHEGEIFSLAQGGGAFRLEKAGAAAAADTGGIVIKDINGKTYRSDASMRIILGRYPGCQGGFGDGEASVSGMHCELYRVGGKLYLKDLDSTNGTFFSQQERLRPNVPYRIRKGMAFFLTTPKYTFVVVEE